MRKKCKYCKKYFTPNKRTENRQKYCSKKCNRKEEYYKNAYSRCIYCGGIKLKRSKGCRKCLSKNRRGQLSRIYRSSIVSDNFSSNPNKKKIDYNLK